MDNIAIQMKLLEVDERKDKEEEKTRILKLRAVKESILSRFSPEVRNKVNLLLDEVLCGVLFKIHKELKLGLFDPKRFISNYKTRCQSPNLALTAENLNITKSYQKIDCPHCFKPVEYHLFTKHVIFCMNPNLSTYSHSSRISSQIAQQRIQEGFETTSDKYKNDSDDEHVKPNQGSNKGKMSTIKNLRE